MTNYSRIIKVIGRLLCSFKGNVIKQIMKDSFTGGVLVGLCGANLHGTMEKSGPYSSGSQLLTFYLNSCKWRKWALFCNWSNSMETNEMKHHPQFTVIAYGAEADEQGTSVKISLPLVFYFFHPLQLQRMHNYMWWFALESKCKFLSLFMHRLD